MTENPTYKKKDFVSDQEVRWCPGCGDYAILSSVQMALTKIGKKKEDIVFVSGIGCSSRFPYYVNTYGLHTIHGRAPAFASGIKSTNPNLSVWIITGDGDGLSIGGNHLIHILRRNIDCNIILFNNEIYGLTKGQYSPTSQRGLVTKSTPYGSIDRSFTPAKLAIGAGATFFARTMDTDPKHMQDISLAAEEHRGTSLIEAYQNCVIFNDGVHDLYTNRKTRDDHCVFIEHGQPMIFGKDKNKGIKLTGSKLEVVTIGENGVTEADLLVHDQTDERLAFMLAGMKGPELPVAVGILYKVDDVHYDEQICAQVEEVKAKKGAGDMNKLLHSGDTWEI
ncbi:MAG: 2-oxoacid:ferredoxin oxidoreductase subunit beta [Deltaproteobacteria bacterium]|nr:MAG: 2-oxoacid:ferredoxin oxidoreductase subunit beta [Deltaproteobacteria bacterium]TNF31502.1 MAG: 2-oxoacid:ferredoxin oxidoreductase subunit beta [Deltaproteobacteria bacterium]